MMEFTQGAILERAMRLDIGAGLALTQNADGIPKIDISGSFGISQEYADANYVNVSGDAMTGNLSAPQLYGNQFVQAGVGLNGFIRMTQGDASHTGYLEFYRVSGLRNGYLGYDLNNVLLQLENSASFLVGSSGYTSIGPDGQVIIGGSGVDRLTLAGSPTNNLQIALGNSSVAGRLGTMLSSGAPFISYNAYQNTPGADSWTQSYGLVASSMLEITAGIEPFAFYTAVAGRSVGTKGAFWGTPIFRLTSGGWPIISSGATYFYGTGPDTFGGSGVDNYGGNAPYIFNYHTGLTFTSHDAYGGLRIYAQGYPTLWPSTLVARFMQSSITLVSPVALTNGLSVSGNVSFGAMLLGAVNKGLLIGNSFFGQQGSGYGEVGYNNNDGVGNANYAVTDFASRIRFNSGGLSFQTAPSGTAGALISWAERLLITQAGALTTGGSLTSVTVGEISLPNNKAYRASNLANSATYALVYLTTGDQVSVDGNGRGAVFGASILATTSITATTYLRSSTNLYLDQNFGSSIVGNYEPAHYQGVYSMGAAYALPLGGTSVTGFYGLAWIYDHPSYLNVTALTLEHALALYANGVVRSVLGMNGIFTNGFIRANGYIQTTSNILGNGEIRAGAYAGGGHVAGDMTARRSATTGVYYFGDYTDRYLYYDGTKFNLSGGSLRLGSGQVEAADFLLI